MITEQEEVAHRKSRSSLTSVLSQQQLSRGVVFWGVLEVQTPRRRSNGTEGWSWSRWALTQRLQAACRSSLVLGLAGCFGYLPKAEGRGVPGMPSSVVSCNFGILPILLLTLPVIEELIFRPCSIQGHDIWRQRYKLSLQASLERPRGVTSQPWSQCLECQQLNCYFSVFWLTLGQHSSMCTALSVDLYYCQAVEAYQLCLLNGVCKYCCFCSCLI